MTFGSDGATASAPTEARLEEAVGDVLPVRAAVGRLPDAAARRAEVEDLLVDGIAGDGDDAPAAERPDQAPFERVEERGIALPAGLRCAADGRILWDDWRLTKLLLHLFSLRCCLCVCANGDMV